VNFELNASVGLLSSEISLNIITIFVETFSLKNADVLLFEKRCL